MEDYQQNKKYKEPQAGIKKQKKDKKKGKDPKLDMKGKDPRAFTVNSMNRAKKLIQYGEDKKERKLRNPVRNREDEADIPPPLIVAVTGPPKVGKTLLIKCLVKTYTKTNVSFVGGPITIVTGKKKRITFIECPNDVNAMLDISKIADLVLTCIDAKFGFEMETFEMLNMLQTHGFPKVMGVLTHLDLFKDAKTQRKTKKELKRRFWTELFDGAKLFYLSGLINGKYPKREIFNLSRFISVSKFKPLLWRTAHPYLLVDRLEDLTDEYEVQCNPYCDRTVAFFGYLRGAVLKKDTLLHVPGCGDLSIHDLSVLPDPCPLPSSLNQKRTLSDKEKTIYAPMSNFGQLIYDKDAVYINLPKNKVLYSQPSSIVTQPKEDDSDEEESKEDIIKPIVSDGQKLVKNLQTIDQTIDQNLSKSTIQLFGSSKPLLNSAFKEENNGEEDESEESDESDGKDDDEGEINMEDEDVNDDYYKDDDMQENENNDFEERHSRKRRPVPEGFKLNNDNIEENEDDSFEGESGEEIQFEKGNLDDESGEDEDENDDDDEDDEEGITVKYEKDPKKEIEVEKIVDYVASDVKWKENIIENAKKKFKKIDLMQLVYGDDKQGDHTLGNDGDVDSDNDEDFFKPVSETKDELQTTENQSDSSKVQFFQEDILNDEEFVENLKSKFTVSKAEAQELFTVPSNPMKKPGEEAAQVDLNEEDYINEKEKKKELFDKQYDTSKTGEGSKKEKEQEETFFSITKQKYKEMSQSTKEEFKDDSIQNKILYKGYGAGYYVRIICKGVPGRFIQYHEGKFPVIMGGVLNNEKDLTILEVRLKKHRWYNTVLKTNNPIIYSIGWRRFESLPLYFMNSNRPNEKSRMIKYTPLHLHCLASFYGPTAPPGSGVMCVQSVDQREGYYHQNFRVAATGVVLQQKKTSDIYKKLKLIGHPFDIYKKTAFIKDMFNSELEVSKFIGAKIKTVSGIRGQIKKSNRSPPGSFRATFEDKIKKSDIVFLRSWYPVAPRRYYNPITSLLLRDKSTWKGMKTVGHLRIERGLKIPVNRDSKYTQVKRMPIDEMQFAPVKISNSLASSLPFSSQPKAPRPPKSSSMALLSSFFTEKKDEDEDEDKKQPRRGNKKRKNSSIYEHPLLDRTIIREPKERKVAELFTQLNAIKKEKLKKKSLKSKEKNRLKNKKKTQENAKRKEIMKKRKKEFFQKNAKHFK